MNLKASRAQQALPQSVQGALRKIGADISTARRRRKLTTVMVAERAFISRNTITRVERGDPGVSLGIYATGLFVLGLADRLGDLADPATDTVGMSLEQERLPERVRMEVESYAAISAAGALRPLSRPQSQEA